MERQQIGRSAHKDRRALEEVTRLLLAAPPLAPLPSDLWKQIISDAVSIIVEGWASKALALGWTYLDLFGLEPGAFGEPSDDGLANMLQGRRIRYITTEYADVIDILGLSARIYKGGQGTDLIWLAEANLPA